MPKTTTRKIAEALETLAPLAFQEDYDNAGLQVGLLDAEVTGVLVCLDITEEIIAEAVRKDCNLVVSHHPLIFKPLKRVSDATYQQRCVMQAVRHGITLYSAHTNLDNAEDGVNYRIASLIGLRGLSWLEEKPAAAGRSCGSGVVGDLPEPEPADAFLARLKETFGIKCLMHTDPAGAVVRRIALCGGAGSFLMDAARAAGADCFITGEISYHHFFDADGLLLVAMGHYQSEQFTKDLLRDFLSGRFPGLRVEMTETDTNPIHYS